MSDGSSKVLTVDNPSGYVRSVALSPDGQFAAAGMLNSGVHIWDVATGSIVEHLKGYAMSAIAFTLYGTGLVIGTARGVRHWDLTGLKSYRHEDPKATGAVSSFGGGGPVMEDGNQGRQCTMEFTGHTVQYQSSLLLYILDFSLTVCYGIST